MSSERWKQVVLGALLVILTVALYRAVRPATTPAAGPGTARAAGAAPQAADETPGVGLERLSASRGAAPVVRRNPFRFEERRSDAGQSVSTPKGSSAVPSRPPVPANPADAPIGLVLIGIVEGSDKSVRVAVLSDDRGVYHGHEGDIIEGRFRIVQIGADSVEMSRLDSQTRQVIRLPGATVP